MAPGRLRLGTPLGAPLGTPEQPVGVADAGFHLSPFWSGGVRFGLHLDTVLHARVAPWGAGRGAAQGVAVVARVRLRHPIPPGSTRLGSAR